jgi:hypothetical protein
MGPMTGFDYLILLSGGSLPGGRRKDLTKAKTAARRWSATVTSLIIVVTGADGRILAAYERGEPTPLDKAEFVVDYGYRALADTGWVT